MKKSLTIAAVVIALILMTPRIHAAVGEVAPQLHVEDVSGRVITLDDFRGKSALVLIFYHSYG